MPRPTCQDCNVEMEPIMGGLYALSAYDVEENRIDPEHVLVLAGNVCTRCGLLAFHSVNISEPEALPENPKMD